MLRDSNKYVSVLVAGALEGGNFMRITTKNGVFYADEKNNTIRGGYLGERPMSYDSLNLKERKVLVGRVTTFVLPPILMVEGGA